jgi:SAM-dependent methyltransferase
MKDVFDSAGVDDYARARYRKPDQRFVHRRERRILQRILRRAEGTGWVLDIPCGYGRLSGLLLEQGFKVVGCDLSLSMVKKALTRFPSGEGRHRVVVGDAVRGLPFQADSFVGVVCIRLFHHLHEKRDRETALQELGRLARDFVVVSYYRRNALHAAQRRIRRRLKPSQASIRMVSRADFLASVDNAGMEVVVETALLSGLHAQHFVLLRAVRNGR